MAQLGSILFFRLKETNTLSNSEVIKILKETDFSKDKGIGFKSISLERDNYVIGSAEKNTPVFMNVFDIESQSIVKREEILVSEIEFAIDFNLGLIEVFGKSTDARKLKIVFNEVFGDSFSFLPIDLNLSETLEILKNGISNLEIKKLTVKNFACKKGLLGTYDASVLDNEIAFDLINSNTSNLTKVVISGNINQEGEFLVVIDTFCKLKVKSKNTITYTNFLNLFKKTLSI